MGKCKPVCCITLEPVSLTLRRSVLGSRVSDTKTGPRWYRLSMYQTSRTHLIGYLVDDGITSSVHAKHTFSRTSIMLRFLVHGGFWLPYDIIINLMRIKTRCINIAEYILASLKHAYSPCVLSSFLRSCGWFFFVFIFFCSPFPLFSISIWTSIVPSCFFLVGTRMLSPRFRFLLRLV